MLFTATLLCIIQHSLSKNRYTSCHCNYAAEMRLGSMIRAVHVLTINVTLNVGPQVICNGFCGKSGSVSGSHFTRDDKVADREVLSMAEISIKRGVRHR